MTWQDWNSLEKCDESLIFRKSDCKAKEAQVFLYVGAVLSALREHVERLPTHLGPGRGQAGRLNVHYFYWVHVVNVNTFNSYFLRARCVFVPPKLCLAFDACHLQEVHHPTWQMRKGRLGELRGLT